jgi:integrase/recombinase XerD
MDDFSFQEFEEEFLNKKTEDKTNAYSWYEQKISELKKGGYLGNLQTYEYSLKSIKDFSNEPDVLKFNKITPDFLKKYENWMLTKGRTKHL